MKTALYVLIGFAAGLLAAKLYLWRRNITETMPAKGAIHIGMTMMRKSDGDFAIQIGTNVLCTQLNQREMLTVSNILERADKIPLPEEVLRSVRR